MKIEEDKYEIIVEDYSEGIISIQHFDNMSDVEIAYELMKIKHPNDLITVSKLLMKKTKRTEIIYNS